MVDESKTTTLAQVTHKSQYIKAKKEKINLTEDEIDVLVSLWSKKEVLFHFKHADYRKMDAMNTTIVRILKKEIEHRR